MKLGLLSDAHGNTQAFHAALNALKSAGAEDIWYLGDALGYIPSLGVLNHLIDHKMPALLGNHEEMVLAAKEASRAEQVYRHHQIYRTLSQSQLDYVEALPTKWVKEWHDQKVWFVHGGPTDPIWEYVYPDTDLTRYGDADFDMVFMGHTHRPMHRVVSGKHFVNVGSCGIPRDGSGYGSACLFDTETHDVALLHIDITASCRAVLERFSLHQKVLKHLEPIAIGNASDEQ